ncbi:hypothetical protein KKB10_05770 [Patescibacteria group bacterium]|nr:hypothetical protein [Patescibacteria group bacterium]MBU1075534.1 hypothetical protein [Patescibacteria group bacterium]MBU1951930.1 hypothetical protein [Patescibacteria group bacterium]
MDSNSKIKKRTIRQLSVAYVVILLEFLIILTLGFKLFYGNNPYMSFDSRDVHKNNNIQNKDSITCHVIYSTHGNSGLSQWQYELSEFEIWDLSTDTPKLVLNGKQWSELQKLYDGKDYVSLLVGPSWDVDTIGIRKTAGTFVRTMHGDQAGTFQYAIAQKGWCE